MEEAGDLTFLMFFLGRLLARSGFSFGSREILDAAVDKMVGRHPHVFKKGVEDGGPSTPEEVLVKWHALKRIEKKNEGLLESVPLDLPALARCARLGAKAGKAGFDWPDAAAVREKVSEELRELDEEIREEGVRDDPERLQRAGEELGDLLASVASLARHLGLSPEKCLQEHNSRFAERVGRMEKALSLKGKRFEDASPAELDELWRNSKSS